MHRAAENKGCPKVIKVSFPAPTGNPETDNSQLLKIFSVLISTGTPKILNTYVLNAYWISDQVGNDTFRGLGTAPFKAISFDAF